MDRMIAAIADTKPLWSHFAIRPIPVSLSEVTLSRRFDGRGIARAKDFHVCCGYRVELWKTLSTRSVGGRMNGFRFVVISLVMVGLTGCAPNSFKAQDEMTLKASSAYFENTELRSSVSSQAAIEKAIQTSFPACKFETISVIPGKSYSRSSDETNRAYVTYTLNRPSFPDDDRITFAGSGVNNDYRVCNTKGKALKILGVKNFVNGNPLKDDLGFTYCSPKEKKRFAQCKARIEKISTQGLWFVIHDYGSSSNAVKFIKPLLEAEFKAGWGSYPLAVVGSHIVSPVGPFDSVNWKTISDFDKGWSKFLSNTKAKSSSEIVSGYPKYFDRRRWVDDFKKIRTANGSRIELDWFEN